MADFLVGLIAKIVDLVTGKFYFQTSNLQMASDEYEAKDENGNTAEIQYINHRVTCNVDAILSAKTPVPVPGDIVKLSGLKLPTVDEHGNVTGTFEVDPDSNTEYEFKVTSESTITQSNQDYTHCSFSVVRYLVNGLPDSQDSN